MNNVITPVTVDLITPSIIRKMYVKQGDDGRGALITLTENGQVYDPTGATARIFVQKSDMTQVYANCTIVSGKILALLPEQALTAAGPADVELELSTAEQVITTPIFQLIVLQSNRSGIISTADFQALTEALEELEDIRDNVLTPTTALAYSTPSSYSAPASGDTIQTLFGKITKGLSDIFASLAQKLDVSKVIASTNITQAGFVMDGKTCSDAIAQLNDDLSNQISYSNGHYIYVEQRNITFTNSSVSISRNLSSIFSAVHFVSVTAQASSEAIVCALTNGDINNYSLIIKDVSSPNFNSTISAIIMYIGTKA